MRNIIRWNGNYIGQIWSVIFFYWWISTRKEHNLDMQYLIIENLMSYDSLNWLDLFGRVKWWTYVIGISCLCSLAVNSKIKWQNWIKWHRWFHLMSHIQLPAVVVQLVLLLQILTKNLQLGNCFCFGFKNRVHLILMPCYHNLKNHKLSITINTK